MGWFEWFLVATVWTASPDTQTLMWMVFGLTLVVINKPQGK